MGIPSRGSSRLVKNVPVVVAVLVLVIAMVADTKFLTTAQSAARQPAQFNAGTYAAKTFPKLVAQIAQKATNITVLAPAVEQNLAAAGAKYGNDLGAGQFAFPVTATGKVTQADENFLVLSVPRLRAKDTVRIPLGIALSGLPVRDATGTIKFGDFEDQSDYQSVANALGLIMKNSVLAPLHPATLKGKRLTVVGAWGSGGPPDSYIIQPVSIKVAP
jgi:predicted lipoprotein